MAGVLVWKWTGLGERMKFWLETACQESDLQPNLMVGWDVGVPGRLTSGSSSGLHGWLVTRAQWASRGVKPWNGVIVEI